jgi:hypothetical protein
MCDNFLPYLKSWHILCSQLKIKYVLGMDKFKQYCTYLITNIQLYEIKRKSISWGTCVSPSTYYHFTGNIRSQCVATQSLFCLTRHFISPSWKCSHFLSLWWGGTFLWGTAASDKPTARPVIHKYGALVEWQLSDSVWRCIFATMIPTRTVHRLNQGLLTGKFGNWCPMAPTSCLLHSLCNFKIPV